MMRKQGAALLEERLEMGVRAEGGASATMLALLGRDEHLKLEHDLPHGRAGRRVLVPHGRDDVDDFASPLAAH